MRFCSTAGTRRKVADVHDQASRRPPRPITSTLRCRIRRRMSTPYRLIGNGASTRPGEGGALGGRGGAPPGDAPGQRAGPPPLHGAPPRLFQRHDAPSAARPAATSLLQLQGPDGAGGHPCPQRLRGETLPRNPAGLRPKRVLPSIRRIAALLLGLGGPPFRGGDLRVPLGGGCPIATRWTR